MFRLCFLFHDPPTTAFYTLSLHDALPILGDGAPIGADLRVRRDLEVEQVGAGEGAARTRRDRAQRSDRKSTRLNSSHRCISYAVFCLKKKRKVARLSQLRSHVLGLLLQRV